MSDIKPQADARPPHIIGLKKPLGVVGGMGSLATAKFLQALAQKSDADTDQNHVPFITLSLPNISDQSHAISIGSNAPLGQVLARAKWLENVGCGAIAIPCHTAHFWSSEIANALTIKFISIVEVTRDFIHQHNETDIDNLRTIVLGMKATIQHKLYGNSTAGWGGAVPNVDSLQQDAARVIDDVKSGNISRARFEMALLVARTRSLKPDAIILGCSELSLASRDIFKGSDVIDPVDILVDACISWFRET
ncbi:aspartate/glutamate racemase family protein [Rhizobium laguerreae]|uniref:aspartate/glutamate racemase family protein n=1 Tax=Rhizobium laguerreae TaxID=1076926 RepID=UPI001C905950|nr:amino acid racemase [Rhizobium laguerreae]MBY3469330.1 aspartate/glutamate racemase family protein [Rhizobium laguerreae]